MSLKILSQSTQVSLKTVRNSRCASTIEFGPSPFSFMLAVLYFAHMLIRRKLSRNFLYVWYRTILNLSLAGVVTYFGRVILLLFGSLWDVCFLLENIKTNLGGSLQCWHCKQVNADDKMYFSFLTVISRCHESLLRHPIWGFSLLRLGWDFRENNNEFGNQEKTDEQWEKERTHSQVHFQGKAPARSGVRNQGSIFHKGDRRTVTSVRLSVSSPGICISKKFIQELELCLKSTFFNGGYGWVS